MSHEEIFKEEIHRFSNEEHVDEKKNHLWKILLGVILLILLILYFSSGPFGLSNIIGLIGSDKINEYIIENRDLVVELKVYDELKQIFNEDPRNEFKVCLYGEREGNKIIINSLSQPKVYDESLLSITTELCPKETLINLHSHPFNNCVVSQTDKDSQNYFKEINTNSIGAVMCGIDRFILYG